MHILTGSQQMSVRRQGGNYRKWVERTVQERYPRVRVVWSTRPGAPVIRAYIKRGSWVADCPICKGSQVVEPGEPFFCVDCLMLWNAGYAQKCWFPRKDRRVIERLLMLRPNPLNRNWLVGETVDQLRAENIEHGLPTDLDNQVLLPILKPKPRKPSPNSAALLLEY